MIRYSLIVLLITASAAHAQPASPEVDARTHFDQGQRFTAAGNYAAAYREFEAGYRANPRPAFLFNMGEAARALGDSAKARAAYEQFLVVESTGDLADTARQRLIVLGAAPPIAESHPPAPPPVSAPPTLPAPHEVAAKIEASPTRVVRTAQPNDERPVWKKWPLWAAIGGAVLTGIAIGVVVTREESPSCGAACIDFR